MNYLAHACLSFNEADILVGNMISDFVKGKKQFDYPDPIRTGIILHRLIDTFTDQHPATKIAKNFFRPRYRLYAGAIVDVVYDHFLALDEKEFESYGGLRTFSHHVYQILEKNSSGLPPLFQGIFPSMKNNNWLYHYKYQEGIRKSLAGLAFRAAFLTESAVAYDIFINNYVQLQTCFKTFFPAVKSFAFDNLRNLTKG